MDECAIINLFKVVSHIRDGPTWCDRCPVFCVLVNRGHSRLGKLVSGFEEARKDSIERLRTPEVVRGDSGDGEEEERDPSFMTVSSPSSPEVVERVSPEWTPKDKRLLTGRKQ